LKGSELFTLKEVLAILVSLSLTALVWAVVTASFAKLLGATVLEIRLFAGPQVKLAQLGETSLALGLMPFGSSVRFLDQDFLKQVRSKNLQEREEQSLAMNEDEAAERLPAFWQGRKPFEQLRFVSRVGIILCGWLVILWFARWGLGRQQVGHEFLATYYQVLRYLLEPDFALAAIRWLRGILTEGYWLTAIALLSVKITALNFIPLPFLAGGALVRETASALTARSLRLPAQWVGTTFIISIGLLFLFLIRTWNALHTA
jgi:membrane-associated protease RseP (regulator of RpoE activity)